MTTKEFITTNIIEKSVIICLLIRILIYFTLLTNEKIILFSSEFKVTYAVKKTVMPVIAKRRMDLIVVSMSKIESPIKNTIEGKTTHKKHGTITNLKY